MAVRNSVYDLGVLLEKARCEGFEIAVCDKDATLGSETFRQFWLKNTSVYGGRKRPAENQAAILGFFHRMALDIDCDVDHRNAAPTYLLASLASDIRSNKSQDVFPDASPANTSSAKRYRMVADLDDILKQTAGDELSCDDFYCHSRTVGDLAEPSDEVAEEYLMLESHLYAGVLDDWVDEPEICARLVQERWRDWTHRARRSDCSHVFKNVLNVLSYESKAALHQCYSLLWLHLADAFAKQEDSLFVRQFHRFWHCDHRVSTGDVQDMHLFHGHVFGLHPAFSLMIQTETGGSIIADAVGKAMSSVAMRTFFAAGIVSLNFYVSDRIENRRRR